MNVSSKNVKLSFSVVLLAFVSGAVAMEGQQTLEDQLMLAVMQHSLKDVDRLINEGANVNTQKYAILYGAVQGGQGPIVKRLLAAKADINKEGEGVILSLAAQMGKEDIAEDLIAAGANIDAAIAVANRMKDLKAVRFLNKFKNKLLEDQLMLAVRQHSLEDVDRLINKGVNVNTDRYAILYGAIQGGQGKIVKRLLAAKADVNKEGEGALLFLAAKMGKEDIAEDLIAAGANIDAAIAMADKMKNLKAVRFLNKIKNKLAQVEKTA
jgi:ankyrin repeat protein